MNRVGSNIKDLTQEISSCIICNEFLEPRPVFSVHTSSKIVIIGQAPGSVVHRTGVPWDDKSGENLRAWMEISSEVFYDNTKISIIPMGFCYPGKGKTGDLPPRKECAPLWHSALMERLQNVELILLIGKYAQDYYLGNKSKKTLTETVRNYQDYLPKYFVLPHPSPRNNIWQAKNPWFKEEVIPELRTKVHHLITEQ